MKALKLFVILIVLFWALPALAQMDFDEFVSQVDIDKQPDGLDLASDGFILGSYQYCGIDYSDKDKCLKNKTCSPRDTLTFNQDYTGRETNGSYATNFVWKKEGKALFLTFKGGTTYEGATSSWIKDTKAVVKLLEPGIIHIIEEEDGIPMTYIYNSVCRSGRTPAISNQQPPKDGVSILEVAKEQMARELERMKTILPTFDSDYRTLHGEK